MAAIKSVHARQILDSRGTPTVEVEVLLVSGVLGRASIPSGASTGTHEALELRDGDKAHFQGKGVEQAVTHVNDILGPAILNNDPFNQVGIDNELVTRDGSANLSTYGANAILGVSLAVARAATEEAGMPFFQYVRHLYNFQLEPSKHLTRWKMPTPMFNVMNGGAHTDWQSTDFQEFMVVPQQADTFAVALEQGASIYHELEKVLQTENLSTLVGDEGGYAPVIKDNSTALELLSEACHQAKLPCGKAIGFGIDAAASEFYTEAMYHLKRENCTMSSADMITYWQELSNHYPIISLEDALAEDDWSGWMTLTTELGKRLRIVGDDLLVTNAERIEKAIHHHACNTLLMKINQIGTLTESFRAVQIARQAGWQIIVSHRSGETEDTSIADIAVGIDAEFVKMGAPARSERTAKYNQLLRIEEHLHQ